MQRNTWSVVPPSELVRQMREETQARLGREITDAEFEALRRQSPTIDIIHFGQTGPPAWAANLALETARVPELSGDDEKAAFLLARAKLEAELHGSTNLRYEVLEQGVDSVVGECRAMGMRSRLASPEGFVVYTETHVMVRGDYMVSVIVTYSDGYSQSLASDLFTRIRCVAP